MSSREYLVSDILINEPTRHCVSLAIAQSIIRGFAGTQPVINERTRNGTLTLVRSEGIVYGITCWHVIEELEDSNKRVAGTSISYSFYILNNNPTELDIKFIRPDGLHKLDIGICILNPEIIAKAGKIPLDIDNMLTPQNLEFGYVVGYPEILKYVKDIDKFTLTKTLSLPNATALAEIEGTPSQRFKLFSEFDKPQSFNSYSGMSGGPIYWSKNENYGIFGIIYEAAANLFANSKESISVAGELATPEKIKEWIKQIPK